MTKEFPEQDYREKPDQIPEEEGQKTAGEEGAEEETWGRSKENIREEDLDKFLREFKAKKEKEAKEYKKKKHR